MQCLNCGASDGVTICAFCGSRKTFRNGSQDFLIDFIDPSTDQYLNSLDLSKENEISEAARTVRASLLKSENPLAIQRILEIDRRTRKAMENLIYNPDRYCYYDNEANILEIVGIFLTPNKARQTQVITNHFKSATQHSTDKNNKIET